MAKRHHIDDILRDWPYESQSVSVRIIKAGDGREVIQMRVEMGLLQIETSGRPDGTRPEGHDSYFDYLQSEAAGDEDFKLSEEQCNETDREFVQYYHRRICWLAMRKFERAVEDADHTLGLMDFCRAHSPDEQWTMSHEQYRPFVLFHRTQAAALAELEAAAERDGDSDGASEASGDNGKQRESKQRESKQRDGKQRESKQGESKQRDSKQRDAVLRDTNGDGEDVVGAEAAVNVLNDGLDRLREVFVQYGVEEHFDDDDLVTRLIELREELRQKHALGRTLREQLSDAVAAEQYERAARIRDELARREYGRR
jgi:hypothetical protein